MATTLGYIPSERQALIRWPRVLTASVWSGGLALILVNPPSNQLVTVSALTSGHAALSWLGWALVAIACWCSGIRRLKLTWYRSCLKKLAGDLGTALTEFGQAIHELSLDDELDSLIAVTLIRGYCRRLQQRCLAIGQSGHLVRARWDDPIDRLWELERSSVRWRRTGQMSETELAGWLKQLQQLTRLSHTSQRIGWSIRRLQERSCLPRTVLVGCVLIPWLTTSSLGDWGVPVASGMTGLIVLLNERLPNTALLRIVQEPLSDFLGVFK